MVCLGYYHSIVQDAFGRWFGFEVVAFLSDIPTIFLLYAIHYKSF